MKSTGKTVVSGVPRLLFLAANYLLFTALVLMCIYPVWFILISSLSGSSGTSGVLLPRGFSFQNYENVVKIKGVFPALGVSVMRTIVGTVCTVVTSMFLGYLFTKKVMPFRTILYRGLVVTMYISGGLIPTYLVIRSYGLLNNFWVYILPGMASAYYIILIKTFVEQLPVSVEESAMLDGAGTLTIFFQIIVPMSMPIVATIAIFSGVGQWNSWFDNHIYAFQNKNLITLQYLLYNYLKEAENLIRQMMESSTDIDISKLLTPKGVRMTITMVTITPVLFIYPFLQRYFVKGIVIGAVKG
ncbi:MAG: carbohydrate ABC transporter permease [Treponema sp.]|jgi:multiple sugar transport system permease protein/putative aldouronate transport system permease protein|nr:carbohydrate ABC transporter permease [Treponema sp.]